MLTIWGKAQQFCDGVSRRDFVQVGALGASLTMADILLFAFLDFMKGVGQPLDPANTKLFLVSQGDIALSSLRNAGSRDMRALSIVAGGNVEFMPPPTGSTCATAWGGTSSPTSRASWARSQWSPASGSPCTRWASTSGTC